MMFTKQSLSSLGSKLNMGELIAFFMPNRIECPFCNHTKGFIINPDGKKGNCIRCDWQGDCVALMMGYFKYSFEKTCQELSRFYEVTLEEIKKTTLSEEDSVKDKITKYKLNKICTIDDMDLRRELISLLLESEKKK